MNVHFHAIPGRISADAERAWLNLTDAEGSEMTLFLSASASYREYGTPEAIAANVNALRSALDEVMAALDRQRDAAHEAAESQPAPLADPGDTFVYPAGVGR